MSRIFALVGPFLFCSIVFTQLVNALSADPVAPSGEAEAVTFRSGTFCFPVKDHSTENIISYFGDPRGKSRKHLGVDIKADRHTPILAVVDGKIEAVKESGNGGKTIYLRSADGTLYFYAHLEDWLVEEDAFVLGGQAIATVGDSGNAKGTTPHLHFEIMQGKERTSIDPLPVLSNLE